MNDKATGRAPSPHEAYDVVLAAIRVPALAFSVLLQLGSAIGSSAIEFGDDSTAVPELARARLREAEWTVRDRLLDLLTEPAIREAVAVASPSLIEALPKWRNAPLSRDGHRVERSLMRYLSRMASRPTPFGLFAGCGAVNSGSTTHFDDARWTWRRRTRPDMYYLAAVAEALAADATVRAGAVLHPNTSLYRIGDSTELRYMYRETGVPGPHLRSVERDDVLDRLLRISIDGASRESLVSELVGAGADVDDAGAYVDRLIEEQVLVTSLTPAIITDDVLSDLITQLSNCGPGASQSTRALTAVRTDLAALDTDCVPHGEDPYLSAPTVCAELPVQPERERYVQVDLSLENCSIQVGTEVRKAVLEGVQAMRALGSVPARTRFKALKEAFAHRYGDQFVPLPQMLDYDLGLGKTYLDSAQDLPESLREAAGTLTRHGRREYSQGPWAWVLKKVADAWAGQQREIRLTPRDLPQGAELPELPDAFAVLCSIAAENDLAIAEGRFRVVMGPVHGPAIAALVGRFCQHDKALHDMVTAVGQAEQQLHPDTVYAEVVHLPRHRHANILLRPRLTEHDIVYLGRSAAPRDHWITIDDLLIRLAGDNFAMYSRRLQRQVVPRLTTAHNWVTSSDPIYHFLCDLQYDDWHLPSMWDWGPLGEARFLPRVLYGRAVLARAQWTLSNEDLGDLADPAKACADIWRYRERHGLPRFVTWGDSDEVSVVDLENPLSVVNIVEEVRRRKQVALTEMLPGPDELCVHPEDGRRTHELVVGFVRRTAQSREPAPVLVPSEPVHARPYIPGEDWLYVSLQTGWLQMDAVLRAVIAPFIESMRDVGHLEKWFFIRYYDPEPHLRLRLRVHQGRWSTVYDALRERLPTWRASSLISSIRLDTYVPETQRYGGPQAMELAESIFCADSEAALEVLSSGLSTPELRWQACILGLRSLLTDFRMDPTDMVTLLRDTRRGGQDMDRALNGVWRRNRTSIEALLGSTVAGDGTAEVREIWSARSAGVAPAISKLIELGRQGALTVPLRSIVASLLHMQCNRVLGTADPVQEAVCYGVLERALVGELHRSGRLTRGRR